MKRGFLLVACTAGSLLAGSFDKDVEPLLRQSCTGCHNEKLASGGLNIGKYLDPASLTSGREGWEHIFAKLRSGEMPPKGMPRPDPAKIDSLTQYLQSEFDRIDKNTPVNPGRITAHRLNR